MNCLDVRRSLLVDPGRIAAGASDHLRACAACRRFAAEVSARERLIDHALHVPLPPGLERRLLEPRGGRPIGRLRGTLAPTLVSSSAGLRTDAIRDESRAAAAPSRAKS